VPTRRENTYRTDYRTDHRRNDGNRRDTRPLDLNMLTKAPKEILSTEHQLRLHAPPPLRGRPSRENMDKFCDYHGEKGHLTNDCHNLKTTKDESSIWFDTKKGAAIGMQDNQQFCRLWCIYNAPHGNLQR
jgi:hypothetical protein